ncbi:hypothetical protein GCM10027037_24850 [Mucilaginibacter koreensis]
MNKEPKPPYPPPFTVYPITPEPNAFEAVKVAAVLVNACDINTGGVALNALLGLVLISKYFLHDDAVITKEPKASILYNLFIFNILEI